MTIKILSFFILAVAAGCSKEVTNAEKITPVSKSAKLKSGVVYAGNPQNPADSIGIIHNQALSYVYEKLRESKNFKTELKEKYVTDFFEKRYGGSLLKSIKERQQLRYRQFKHVPVLELTAKLGCSAVMVHSINSLLQAAYKMKSPKDYSTFKETVMILEKKVIVGKLKLSRTEADQLLHFTSVLRHSMWFWMDAVSENQEQSEAELLRRFIKALTGSLADAHGALVSLATYMSFKNVLEDASLDSAMMLWAFGF